MSTAYYFISDGRIIYTKNGRLADLQQRKSALDCFFERCSDVLPRHEQLYRRLYRELSESAVGHASAAFNDGEMGIQATFRFCAGGFPGDKEFIGMGKTNLQTLDGRADMAL
jgi:hypothetical protein